MNELTEILGRKITLYAALIVGTWVAMACAVLIDLWTGIDKAKARGEKIDSHNIRRTIRKMGDYWRVQVFGLLIDVFAALFVAYPIASILIGGGVIAIELRSVIENLRAKRSAAAELPDMVARIISAKNAGDAAELIKLIQAGSKPAKNRNS